MTKAQARNMLDATVDRQLDPPASAITEALMVLGDIDRHGQTEEEGDE